MSDDEPIDRELLERAGLLGMDLDELLERLKEFLEDLRHEQSVTVADHPGWEQDG